MNTFLGVRSPPVAVYTQNTTNAMSEADIIMKARLEALTIPPLRISRDSSLWQRRVGINAVHFLINEPYNNSENQLLSSWNTCMH